MALQIIKPYVHVEDANGNPYVGALLYVYQPTTTTLASVFTDAGLSVAAANPATSDAAGNFPRLYIAAGTYKLRAVTSANVLIWQEDNIDTGLAAGTGSLPIASGGTGATTAAAARTNLDVPSNSQLTSLAATIATLQSQIQNIVSQPQGYLTPTSGTPVISSDVTAGTLLYYTPLIGDLCPVYGGTQFSPVSFSELTLTLNANHTASNIYDVFFTTPSSVATLVTGPAWNTATAGSGARGTGAGTTELVQINGLWVNKYAMSAARNGATTYAVAANQGTFLGSIAIDAVNGQITCHTSYGQSRKWAISNAYNRKRTILLVGDATATWAGTNAATWQQSNVAAGNKGATFCCLPEEVITAQFSQYGQCVVANTATGLSIGIGVNSTTVTSGKTGTTTNSSSATSTSKNDMFASHTVRPGIGINNINCMENTIVIVANATYYGGSDKMSMRLEWMA